MRAKRNIQTLSLRLTALALVLALLLTLPLGALADLKKGSRGDDVKNVQEMLIDLGFLEDKADGVYGKKTEAAVKKFQKYAGLKQTGRVDEETEWELMDCWVVSNNMMEGDGLDPEELQDLHPDFCCWTTEIDGEGVEYCWRHVDVSYVEKWYYRPGMPQVLEIRLSNLLIDLWTMYIDEMYDEWEESLPDDEQHIAAEQRDLFHETLENDAGWAESNSKKNPLGGLQVKTNWVIAHGVDLCYELHSMKGQTLEENK